MTKIILVAIIGLMPLAVETASAQSQGQCEQVRAAVAQYGYKAAKAHAEATMSPEAVRAADSCVRRHTTARAHHHVTARKRHRVRQITD